MTGTWQMVEVVVDALIGGLLVLATWFLYRATKELAAAASRAEERERDRQQPRVSVGGIIGGAESGFSVTNMGLPDVTIVHVVFVQGVPIEEENRTSGIYSGATPKVIRRNNLEVTLPQRLSHGDVIRVLYETSVLEQESKRTRLQPLARDSLGNTYIGAWLEYRDGGGGGYNDPGEGLRPSQIL
ncbi:MAG: hypothetical protein F4X99_09050 [Gammaproteobacteria bacterium]|nr:hypothetical protein [Gammaproteobacteria bacterium]